MLRVPFICLTAMLAGAAPAQTASQNPAPLARPAAAQAAVKPATVVPDGPSWKSLTPAQREALAPLVSEWDKLDAVRKQKWLEVAARYGHLSPEGKKHVQERMGEVARLTPEQRRTMRENFKRSYELPPEQRTLRVQTYQQLPEDRKRELADKASPPAGTKPEPPRKPVRELMVEPAKLATH